MTKVKYSGGTLLRDVDKEGCITYVDDLKAAYLIAHRGHEFTLVSSTNPTFADLVEGHKAKPAVAEDAEQAGAADAPATEAASDPAPEDVPEAAPGKTAFGSFLK